MKKLIAIAAIAACLPAFSGQVASSNTVGYKKLSFEAGFVMYTPTFLTVGGATLDIQSLKPSGDDVGGWGDVSIQIVDADGNIDANYLWFTAANSGLDKDYWLDDDNNVAVKTFADGDGFLLYSDAGVTLTCMGEVSFAEVTKTCDAGFVGAGNSKNAAFSIQDLAPTGDDVGGWGDVSIQIVDADGNIDANYLWFTAANSGLADDFWLDDNNEVATKVFAPGDGFLLYSDAGVTVTIPEMDLGD